MLHRLRRLLLRERPASGEEEKGCCSSLSRGIDWVRPRSARLNGVGLVLEPLTSVVLVNVGVEGVVTGEPGTEGVFVFFSCHSRRFSLAQEPQELRYAPARWLTGAAVAVAPVSKDFWSGSVAVAAASVEGRGEEPASIDVGGDDDPCTARSSLRLR